MPLGGKANVRSKCLWTTNLFLKRLARSYSLLGLPHVARRTACAVRTPHGAPRAHGAPHLKQQNTLEPCIYATHLEQVVETNQEGANKSFLCETPNFHNEKTGVRGLR